MDHIAIMNKSWKLIPKIVSGEKVIESRWYQTKRTPWDSIESGDIIYFKNSGEPVSAKAEVSKILQFSLRNIADTKKIIKQYGEDICLINKNPSTWDRLPKYCILIFLKDAQYLAKPFQINKTGFGTGAAWLTTKDVNKIKVGK